jgi:hypothetical protein
VAADGTLPATFFPLPPPVADLQRLKTWGDSLVTALRRLQAAGAFGGAQVNENDELVLALTNRLDQFQALFDELLADFESLETGGLTAQQEFLLGLIAATDGVLGSVAANLDATWEQAQRSAMTNGLSMVRGHIDTGVGRTAVINEQTVRLSEDEALAQSVQAVNAALTNTNANVTAVQQAYVAADQAIATQLGAVSTQVAGNTASVVQIAQSVNGVSAQWGISVNAQGQALGTVRLDGGANGSTFAVVANNFYVAQPSVSGGAPVPVFGIGLVNGTPQLALRAEMVVDGAILARHLSVSSLSAITANIGDITAGVMRSSDNKFRIDLTNKTFELLV